MSDPIIRSLLDTDLYKFTMWQPFLHFFPSNHALYEFVCRNEPAYPLAELKSDVEAQLEHLCSLSFAEPELDYLSTKRFLKSHFIDFLRIFRFQRRYVRVETDATRLKIIAEGPQIHVMGFEIFVLAIVNELYFRRLAKPAVLAEGRRRLQEKIAIVTAIDNGRHATPFQFFEFGTRRRFSRDWHEEVVRSLAQECPNHFRGTSNVHWAMKYGVAAIGTMAHEYLQTFQAVGIQLRHFQKAALEHWVQEYRGDLGVALTDVVGMNAFLRDFDLYFAKLFDGLRHDSGDPLEWGEKALAHYQSLRIQPMTKRLVFSDALDIPKAIELWHHFADRVQVGFGIGTNLSNDVGLMPINIVMKLTHCNGQPVAKLSDSPGKALSSNETFIAYLRQLFT